jgi:hypothetical protein
LRGEEELTEGEGVRTNDGRKDGEGCEAVGRRGRGRSGLKRALLLCEGHEECDESGEGVAGVVARRVEKENVWRRKERGKEEGKRTLVSRRNYNRS